MPFSNYMRGCCGFFLLFCGMGMGGLWAQNSAVTRDTILKITAIKDSFQLSHPQLVPFSEQVQTAEGSFLLETDYQISYKKGIFILLNPKVQLPLVVSYRYFLQGLADTLAFQIPNRTTKLEGYTARFLPEELKNQNFSDMLEDGKLKKSGSITRGISVGNAQGSAITSGMRLQLEGDLGDGLKIIGSITDENIPVQPDGTTQQISDLDKIFIQLQKNGIYATIGDYEIEQKGSRFADVYRNVQGLKFGYKSKTTDAYVSGAVAKGKFHSNTLTCLDGVAGPYRLTGRSGEQFFIVLAGSEKVYLNGKLLVRGETNDYVMDYNTAQITFTAKHVITNVTRVVIDFEYTDRYFNRSLVFGTAKQELLKNKLKLQFSYARDADNPNSPFDNANEYFDIKDSLALYGDATGGTVYTSGVFRDTIFNRNQAFYYQEDTLVNGQNFTRYVHTIDSIQAKFRIYFSYVGQGKGYYKRDATGFNQYVYKWTPPDAAGNPTGDFAPVKPWVLPKLLSVYNLQAQYQLTKKIQLYTETGISNTDNNRLSNLNDQDNYGTALLAGTKIERMKWGDSLFYSTDVSVSHIQERYNNLDRVYKAEYGRIWNFNDLNTARANETVGMVKNAWSWRDQLGLKTEHGIRTTGNGRTAFRQVYTLSSNLPKLLQGNYTYTRILAQEDSIQRHSLWQRHEGDVFYQKGIFRLGTEIWIEQKSENIRDSASIGSFGFADLKPYLRTIENKKWELDVSFNYRKDREFLQSRLREKSVAYTHYYKVAYRPSEQFRVQSITSYRILDIQDSLFESALVRDNRILNTNLQLTGNTKNRLLNGSLLYEVASEQIAQRDVRFIRVNPGQGEYEWRDNGDQIQAVNEFILSNNPLLADYIRVVLPTQKFVPTTRPAMQANLRIDLKKIYPKSNNLWKESLRNLKSFSTIRISQSKQRENTLRTYLVQFRETAQDSTLIDKTATIRQEITLFQNETKGDLKFGYQNTSSKQFLQTGDETRRAHFWTFAQRLSLDKNKTLEAETVLGKRNSLAVNFPARNFDLQYWTVNPKVIWQTSRKLRFTLGYDFKHKRNFNDSALVNSRVLFHQIGLENRWNLKDRNNLNSKLNLVAISQQNKGLGPNFNANYELLEALQPGFNAVWQVFSTYYIFKDLELSVTYEGRAAAKQTVVHSGRVQLRALF